MSVRSARKVGAVPYQVLVGAAPLEAVAARTGRDTLFLTNANAAGFIYVSLHGTLVVGDGIPLGPGGGSLVLEGYTGNVWAVSANVLGLALSVQEL